MLPLGLIPLVAAVLPLSPHYEEARQHQFEAAVEYTVDYQRAALKAPTLPSRVVYGFLPYWVKTDPNTFRWDVLTHVIYFSAELSEVGDIKNTHGLFNSSGQSPIVQIAHRNGRKALISFYVPGDLAGLLRLPARRVNAIQKMIALVQAAGADGMDVDFEPVKDNQTEDLFVFMRDLSNAFRAVQPTGEITIDVYAWAPFYPGYDVRRLAPFVDRFLVMGYNYHWTGAAQAGPNSPLTGGKAWKLYVKRSLEAPDGYLALAPLEKLVLGLPYYGYDWPVNAAAAPPNATRGSGFTRMYRDLINQAKGARQWDPESQTPFYSYNDAEGQRQVWYEDAQSLALKYEYVKQQNLPGVMIWALGYDDGHPQLWDALQTAFPPLTSVPLPPSMPVDAGTPSQSPSSPGKIDAGTVAPPVAVNDAGQAWPPSSSQPPQGTTNEPLATGSENAPDNGDPSVRPGYSQTGCDATHAAPLSGLLLVLVWGQAIRRRRQRVD